MVKVKFKGETGEDVRKQILAFLGESASVRSLFVPLTDFASPIQEKDQPKIKENLAPESPAEQTKVEETATTQEKTTRKRRTKEEIEAEKVALESKTDDTPAVENKPEETSTEDASDLVGSPFNESAITKEILTPLVIGKGREGKKAQVIALLEKYGATGLPNLDASNYQSFHDELLKL